jgi:hypothetical protein
MKALAIDTAVIVLLILGAEALLSAVLHWHATGWVRLLQNVAIAVLYIRLARRA